MPETKTKFRSEKPARRLVDQLIVPYRYMAHHFNDDGFVVFTRSVSKSEAEIVEIIKEDNRFVVGKGGVKVETK